MKPFIFSVLAIAAVLTFIWFFGDKPIAGSSQSVTAVTWSQWSTPAVQDKIFQDNWGKSVQYRTNSLGIVEIHVCESK